MLKSVVNNDENDEAEGLEVILYKLCNVEFLDGAMCSKDLKRLLSVSCSGDTHTVCLNVPAAAIYAFVCILEICSCL